MTFNAVSNSQSEYRATAIELRIMALCLRVAINVADHIFEFRCQLRGLWNAVVVDAERHYASGRCDRE